MAQVTVVGTKRRLPCRSSPSAKRHGAGSSPASKRRRSCASTAVAVARRRSSMKTKEGPERTHMAAPLLLSSSALCSVSRQDKASATVLRRPGRYLTVKSMPNSLLIHWCCGTVDKLWSRRNFKL
jgi:hypothetical protein